MQEIEVTITLKNVDLESLSRLLAAMGGAPVIGVATRPVKVQKEIAESTETLADKPAKGKPGRPAKAKVEAEAPAKSKSKKVEVEDDDEDEVEDDEDEVDTDEVEDDEDAGEDEVEDEDEGRAPAKKAKGSKAAALKLDDVIAAFGEFTKAHDRDKAAAVLKKFDVKNLRKAPEELWPKLIKALKV